MIRYDTETTIGRPMEAVFPWLAEAERHERWMDIAETRSLTPGAMRAGSHAEGVIRKGPFRWKLSYEITDMEAPRRFGFRTLPGSAMEWTGVFQLEPTEGGTRIRSAGELRLKGVLRLFEPLIAGEVRSSEAKELETLKALVESTP
jgi:hypothetical protein